MTTTSTPAVATTKTTTAMPVERAREIAKMAIEKTVQHGALTQEQAQVYLDRLVTVPATTLAFDVSVRALWAALEAIAKKAENNVILIRGHKAWDQIKESKAEWFESALAETELFLTTTPHETFLPVVGGEEFVPQRLDEATRFKIQEMILDLEVIAKGGHCRAEGCAEMAEWNAREERFHPYCMTHYAAKLAAQKEAERKAPARTWKVLEDGSYFEVGKEPVYTDAPVKKPTKAQQRKVTQKIEKDEKVPSKKEYRPRTKYYEARDED